MVELIEPLQEEALDQDPARAHHDRRQHQRPPIAEPAVLQQQIGEEGAQHVLGAVGEVDDVEHAENDGEPEAEQRIERAVDQPEQQLPEQRRRRNAEHFEHGSSPTCPQASPVPSVSRIRRPRPATSAGSGETSALHQRAAAFVERAERFGGRDGGAQLVEIAEVLRFLGLLDLEQEGVVDLAAVGADRAFAEQRVVGRHRLHLVDHGLAVRVALERLDRLQILQHPGIDAGLHHGRHLARPFLLPALGEGAVGVVHVPIPSLGHDEALRRRQPHRSHVAREHQQSGEALPALHDAELRRLLDRVDGVAARIGEPDHLGLGRLRLQQEGREVLRVEGMADLADHLAAIGLDHRRSVALERVAEGVVGGEEEPGIAAGLHDRLAGAVCEVPGVVGPVHGIGVALRAREVGGRRPRCDEHLVLLTRDLADRQRDA